MLLSLMRKHAQSWIIKFVIGAIAVVFIFYFGYSFKSDEGVKVAEVNGESIGRVEYEKTYREMLDRLQREYKSVWNDNLIKVFDLKNRALESLIDRKIISQEAKKIGLIVTKDEIREKIMQEPAFQTDGRFDENRYRYILSNNHISPEDFEKSFSMDLLQRKLAQFLMTFFVPSDQEILDSYRYANEKIKLAFIKFSPDEFKASVKKDKEAIKAFFEKRKEDYRIPEKIKIAYITINPESFMDKVKLDEDALRGYYEDNMDMFTQKEQVKASHILFRIPPGASPDEQEKIKEKAESVLEKAKKGEDFAKLAKEYSDDTASASKGGDLGYFSKGRMIKEVEDAAFSLKKGEISLVKSAIGYHILKIDDIKPKTVKTFDEAKPEIESIMKHNRSMDMADEKALSLVDQLPYDVDLKEFASDHDVPYASTDYFSGEEPTPLIRGNSKLLETLFSLQKGDVTEVVEINNEFYIMQLLDKKESYLPDLDEVYARVEVDYIDHMALERAAAEAEKYLQALKEGGNWEELAREKNRTVESTDYFTRRSTPGKIGAAPGLQDEAFKLNADKPLADKVFRNNKGAYVIKWEAKQDIDEAKYQKEKEKYEESLIQLKQQEAFSDWIDRMKAKSDIDVSYFEKFK